MQRLKRAVVASVATVAALRAVAEPTTVGDGAGTLEYVWIKTLAELGAYGVQCFLFVYFLTKWMPARDAANEAQMRQQRDDFLKTLEQERLETSKMREVFTNALTAVQQSHSALIQHVMDRFEKRHDLMVEAINRLTKED